MSQGQLGLGKRLIFPIIFVICHLPITFNVIFSSVFHVTYTSTLVREAVSIVHLF